MKYSVILGTMTAAGLAAGAAMAGTLDDVQARGKLNCGVSTGLFFYGVAEPVFHYIGIMFRPKLCRVF